ncbi:MAG TPA: M48 family metalloprotease [Xanthobacteraceae bacterium]|nr:M48 family metalloprotease [Xanthobacteraceae bacterium]
MSAREGEEEGGRRGLRAASLAATLACALFTASCASVDLDHYGLSEASAARDDVASSLPPDQRKEHERLVAAYGGVYHSPELEALISHTVDRLVAASEKPELKYRVTLLNSPAINAFALPSGTLYVTRGLVALANDTSELSSVLAHEMAHVIARHAAIREDQVRQAMIVSRVISDVVSDPDLGALALAKSKISLASFSRGQELEADAVGVGISARAGYDAYGASRFLTSMSRYATLRSSPGGQPGNGKDQVDFISSHPSTPERISIAVANASQYTAPGSGDREKKEFLDAIDGLVYGDDPKEGFVRGRAFLHPNLGFTFTAPEGFTLENTPQAVLGATSSGREALRLDAVRVPATTPLQSYLASGWIDGVDQNSVEQLSLNGFPAATAIARGDQWSFRLYAIRFGSDVYRLVFAAREITPQLDQAFRVSAETFRRVGADEAKNVRPLRVSVVRVGLGDTVDRLAKRMVVPDRQLERFLVLNGLERDAKLKFGDRVKIVVE